MKGTRPGSFFSHLSLSLKLIILYLLCLLLLASWCGLTIHQAIRTTINQVSFQNSLMLSDLSSSLDNAYNVLDSITKFPVVQNANGDSALYNMLTSSELDLKNDYTYNSLVRTNLANLLSMSTNVYLISVIDESGNHVYCYSDYKIYYTVEGSTGDEYYTSACAASGALRILPREALASLSSMNFPADGLYGIRAVMSLLPYRPHGAVLCCVDMSHAMNTFSLQRVYPEQECAVYSPDGTLLLGTDAGGVFDTLYASAVTTGTMYSAQITAGGRRTLYHFCRNSRGCLCVVSTPFRPLLNGILGQNLVMFAVVFLMAVVLAFVTIRLINSIRFPIGQLTSACESIQQGNIGFTIPEEPSRDEISRLIHAFNEMSVRTRHLVEEIYKKDALQTRTELQLLRSQINPHFIYNTLETIRAEALKNQDAEVASLASMFGKLLHYGISPSTRPVPLIQELDSINDYVELQKLHFGDRLTVHLRVDNSLLAYSVPKLLLQPLVENSIYHGALSEGRRGVIDVLGFLEEDGVHFLVIDNGAPLPPEKVEALNRSILSSDNESSHIGLRNVNRRIQLFYGEGYGIQVASLPGRGFSVQVHIPAVKYKDTARTDG